MHAKKILHLPSVNTIRYASHAPRRPHARRAALPCPLLELEQLSKNTPLFVLPGPSHRCENGTHLSRESTQTCYWSCSIVTNPLERAVMLSFDGP